MIFPVIDLRGQLSLAATLAIKNLGIKYKGSVLGPGWIIAEPFLMFILLFVVFTNIKEFDSENFAVYLLTGIMLYHIFAKGTSNGVSCLRDNSNFLLSLNIKREIFPISTAIMIAIMMLIEVPVFTGLMPVFGFIPSPTILLLPLVLLLLLGLILGITYFLSIITVKRKDVKPIWTVSVHALLFVSPVFWTLESARPILLQIYQINPLGQIIELAHKLVFGEMPTIEEWGMTSIFVIAILLTGFVYFKRQEKTIVEEL